MSGRVDSCGTPHIHTERHARTISDPAKSTSTSLLLRPTVVLASEEVSRCATVSMKTEWEREEPSFMPVAATARFFCPSSMSPSSSASEVTYASVTPAMYT